MARPTVRQCYQRVENTHRLTDTLINRAHAHVLIELGSGVFCPCWPLVSMSLFDFICVSHPLLQFRRIFIRKRKADDDDGSSKLVRKVQALRELPANYRKEYGTRPPVGHIGRLTDGEQKVPQDMLTKRTSVLTASAYSRNVDSTPLLACGSKNTFSRINRIVFNCDKLHLPPSSPQT